MEFIGGKSVRKIEKRHYVLIFLLAFAVGLLLRGAERNSFKIVKNSAAYAPGTDFVYDATGNDKININEARAYELNELHGIGNGLAERIVDYRNKNGNFEVIEDIMKVSGIGENTFSEIKNHIYVE